MELARRASMAGFPGHYGRNLDDYAAQPPSFSRPPFQRRGFVSFAASFSRMG
jgi:hypothetical protein